MIKVLSDFRKIIHIDYEKCIKCGLCANACTCHLMIMDNEIPRPLKERVPEEETNGKVVSYTAPTCANCRVCIIKCPKDAITISADLPGLNYGDKLQEVEVKYPR